MAESTEKPEPKLMPPPMSTGYRPQSEVPPAVEAIAVVPTPPSLAPAREVGFTPPPLAQAQPEHAWNSLFARPKDMRSPGEALQPASSPPPPPPPPRGSKGRRVSPLAIISGFLSFLLVASLCAVAGLSFSQQKIRSAGPLGEDKILYFPPRTEVPEILAHLYREGVIDSPISMNVSLFLEGNRGNVKAGEYLFKRQASLRDVIDTLVSGRQLLHSITIPEGLTSEQIVQRLRESDVLAGDLRTAPKEGLILPETYRVARGMSRSDLIRKMQDEQRKLVEQVWARRDPSLPLRTPFELVTLASIVEKETGKADERPRVAGVFVNRLQKRMKLQSDPTIVYGIVGGKGTLGRGITRDEISRPSPYNTYVIEGLPPGPIANPGRLALEAVANPMKTKDLFFVADGTGGHAFAETLDDHNRNVNRWRALEREKASAANVDRAQGEPGMPNATRPNVALPRGQRGALELPGPGHALVKALPRMAHFDLSARFGVQGLVASGAAPATVLAARIAERRKLAAKKGGGLNENVTVVSAAGRPAVRSRPDRPQLDGDESDFDMGRVDNDVNLSTYPVSPKRLAAQHMRAVKYGAESGTEPGLPAAAQALAPKPSRTPVPIFDASEGTALDPLRDKKWDLTSPKTVPSSTRSPASAGRPLPN